MKSPKETDTKRETNDPLIREVIRKNAGGHSLRSEAARKEIEGSR